MNLELDQKLLTFFNRLSRGCGLVVLCTGLTILLGWTWRADWLRQIYGNVILLKANTAIAFTLLGLALFLLNTTHIGKLADVSKRLAQGAGLSVILLAGLTLIEYALNINLGIDEFLFRDWMVINAPYPGRMADITAVCLLLLGSATLTQASVRAWQRVGQWLSVAGWMIAFTCFIGHLYGVPMLFRPHSPTGMALLTSGVLQLVGLGQLLARVDLGVTRLLASRGPGGLLLRVLLPLLFGSLFLLHWLLDRGADVGWYSHQWQEAVLAVASLLLMSLMIWSSARWLERLAKERQNVTSAFATSEERNHLTAEALNGLLYDWDVQAGTIERSVGLKELLGFEPHEVPTDAAWWYPRILPEDKAALDPLIAETFRCQKPNLETEYRIKHRDGHWVWVSDRSRVLYRPDGKVRRIVGSTIDITQRKLTEQALRENEEQLRTLANSIPQLAWMAEPDGSIFWYNQRWYDYTGTTPDEMLGWGWENVLAPEIRPRISASWRYALRTGTRFEMEFPLRGANGEFRWFLTQANPLRDAQGQLVRWFGTNTDIDESRKLREALREGEERERAQAEQLKALMEAVPAIVWIAHDAECQFISGNRAASELLRMPPATNLSKSAPSSEQQLAHFKVFHQGVELEPHQLPMQLAARGIEVHDYEEEVVFDDGMRLTLYGHAMPLRDADGTPSGAISAFVDITNLKKAEEALRESELRFRNMADNAPVMIWVTAATGVCTYLSQSWFEFTGQTSGAGLGIGWLAAVHPDDRAGAETMFLNATAKQSHFRVEYRLRRHDGVYRWAIDSAAPRFDSHGEFLGFIGSVIDITERKQAEEAFRNSEERLRAALTASGTGTFRWEIQRDKLEWDENLDRLFGLEPGASPPSLTRFINLVHPEERELVRAAFARCAATGVDFDLEFRIVWPDGSLRWLAEKGKTSCDAQGHPLYLTGACVDITASKELEQERERLFAEEQRLRAQAEAHNRAKDEFLTVVSHELRSPLNGVLGYARLVQTNAHNPTAVIQHCEVIERSARTQLRIVEDLLDTARIITGKLRIETQPTDLRVVLEEALAVVQPAAEAKEITLLPFIEPQPQLVNGDAARLQQVIWNLLQNAIKFTDKGGWVEVRLQNLGNNLQITVRDNGPGIEPGFLNAVFDRFSQADASPRRRHGGLGLGLALARQLVELHGGTIKVASEGKNQGSTFTVTLPSYTPPATNTVASATVLAPLSKSDDPLVFASLPRLDGLHILVIGDEADARKLITASLSEFGAEVSAFASGREALAYLAAEQAVVRVHAAILDIAMPQEDGYSVLQRLRQLPGPWAIPSAQRLPAIALTAHTRSEERLRALAAGFQMHVGKPVEIAELVAVLASLCGRLATLPRP